MHVDAIATTEVNDIGAGDVFTILELLGFLGETLLLLTLFLRLALGFLFCTLAFFLPTLTVLLLSLRFELLAHSLESRQERRLRFFVCTQLTLGNPFC